MGELAELVLEASSVAGVPDAALIRLSGKGAHGAVRNLQAVIQPLLSQGVKKLLFDCAELEFFNSTSFGYLINLSDSLQSAGGAVAFCRVPKRVQIAFDALGLREYFRFFQDVQEARIHFAGMKKEAPSRPPVRAEASASASVDRLPESIKFALPSWLEEVDKPGPPPLDHLRWSALLQTIARRMGTERLQELCRRAKAPPEGTTAQIARGILKGFRSPEDLLEGFDQRMLESLCRLYGIPDGGDREKLMAGLISFVHQSTTESLAGFMEEASKGQAPAPAPASAKGPPEPTHENLFRALQACPMPRLLRSERAGRDLLLKHLAGVFGREKVAGSRTVGRQLTTKVDLDVSQRFGVLVKMGRASIGTKPKDLKKVQNLLGQVALLAGMYGRGNLFIVLFGEIPKEHAAAMGELRGWMEGVGGRVVPLP